MRKSILVLLTGIFAITMIACNGAGQARKTKCNECPRFSFQTKTASCNKS